MEKLSKVLIFAEKESQFGLLCSAAKSIAEHTAAFAVASAPACPVDKAFVVADQGIVFDDYFETFAAVTAEYAPDAIIVSSEKRMRSIAARIAAVCKTAVIADVNAMEVAVLQPFGLRRCRRSLRKQRGGYYRSCPCAGFV